MLLAGVISFGIAWAPTDAQEASIEKVSQAETQQQTKLAAFFELLDTNDKFMGSVAVAKNGKIIFHRQYGKIAVGAKLSQKPDSETMYRIGSITKTFTAVMIMQLIEGERLTLDGKLSDFFPAVKNAKEISIRQLLGHKSGIGSLTSDPTYANWHKSPMARDKMLQVLAGQPIVFQPGEKTEYSNSNFVLLGFIIEDLTDMTYADALQKRVCDRIGLKHTRYMTPADPSQNVALSFTWEGKQWEGFEQTDPSVPHGAGAIMSTPDDLIRFAEALFAGKLIGKVSLETMKPSGIGIGNGMFAFPFGGKRALGHNGGIDGFQSSLGHFEKDGITMAVIGNGLNFPMNDISIGILSIVFDQPYELPSFASVQLPEETMQRYTGTYARANFPLKIKLSVKDGQLVAQGTGQPSFVLEAESATEFFSARVGVKIAFSKSSPDSFFDTMQLKQGGQNLMFSKE